MNQNFYKKLIEWYRINFRYLPWRNTREPYKIWISEIILQQTKVLQGHDYFLTFLKHFPTVNKLARSSEDEVLKVWQGLGYYSRARNLHSAAKIIVNLNNGKMPENYLEWLQLPGIGPYTAAAISSIANGEPRPCLDGNVKRVTARLYGIDEEINSSNFTKKVIPILELSIAQFEPGEFNQAMMELGALVCLPKNPKCGDCPLESDCWARIHGRTLDFPIVATRKKAKPRYFHFFHIETNGNAFLVKRLNKDIWQGLYEFPMLELDAALGEDQIPEAFNALFPFLDGAKIVKRAELVHKLTHQTIFATFWFISGKASNIVQINPEYVKTKISGVKNFPMHQLMRRYLQSDWLDK